MDAARFICSSPQWDLSGVNTFTGNLFRQFARRGLNTEIILTEATGQSTPYPLPGGVAVTKLPPTRWGAIRQRHNLLYQNLVSRAPCVYLPNYDFNHVPIIEILPPEVKVVLTAHSDEGDYYSMISRFGKAANAIVAVSQTIESNLRDRHPEWNAKIIRIPYGVPVPENTGSGVQGRTEEPLRVVYSGRLTQHQKRIFDLVEVILLCRSRGLPIRFSIAGSGSDQNEVRRRLEPAIGDGTVIMEGLLGSSEMNRLLDQSDVVILTSDYEGLPLILLESMARHCVPVVSRIASGISEVIREGETGNTIRIGDIESFASALARLADDRAELRRMAGQAAEVIRSGRFNIEQSADAYEKLARPDGVGASGAMRRSGRSEVPIHYSWSFRLRKRSRAMLPFSLK